MFLPNNYNGGSAMATIARNENGYPVFDFISYLRDEGLLTEDGDFLGNKITKKIGITGEVMRKIALGLTIPPPESAAVEALSKALEVTKGELNAFFAYESSCFSKYQLESEVKGTFNWVPPQATVIEVEGVGSYWDFSKSWNGEFIEEFTEVPPHLVSDDSIQNKAKDILTPVFNKYFPGDTFVSPSLDEKERFTEAYNLVYLDVLHRLNDKKTLVHKYDIARLLKAITTKVNQKVKGITYLQPVEVPVDGAESDTTPAGKEGVATDL